VTERSLRTSLRRALSNEEQEAIAPRYEADLSVPEMPKLLGIRLSTAQGRVYGALNKLRKALGATEPAGASARHS
jgi:DNA-directed RNA polymerase specialized sigma24 family protein